MGSAGWLAATSVAAVLLIAASCGGRTVDGAGANEADATGGRSSGGSGGGRPGVGGGSAGGAGASGSQGAGGSTTPVPTEDATPGSQTDPNYPYVEWLGGRGYEKFCPGFDGRWGMECWYFDGARSELCYDPNDCNACMCSIACGRDSFDGSVCLPGATGHATPECFSIAMASCMLTCDRSGPCPDGMTCVDHPEYFRRVCVWLRR